jgi:hypothetical protein
LFFFILCTICCQFLCLAQKERRMQVRTFKRSIVLLGKEKLENTKEQ